MAETIKAGYYMGPVTGIMWWIKPDGEARVTTRVDRERKAASPVENIVRDATPMTYAEARAILGDKWPASWPQSEGVAESTAAPATGQAGAGALSGTPSDSFATKALTEGVT